MDFTWLLVAVALVVAAYLWGTWTFQHFANANIPHDKPKPFVGNMGPFLSQAKSFADVSQDTYTKHKGSGVAGFFSFRTPAYMILDPELIKLITIKDFDHFTDHFSVIEENDDPLLGKVLFSLKGDRWKFMRNTLSPAFTSSKMKNMFHLVSDCSDKLADFLAGKCQESGGLWTADMKDLFARHGNDVIATAAFGLQCDSLHEPDNEFYAMGTKAMDIASGTQLFKMIAFMVAAPVMRFFKMNVTRPEVNEFFQRLVSSTVAERQRQNIVRPDMIQLLMQASQGTLEVDELSEVKHDVKMTELTTADMTAQAFIFFLAGFDTTSNNLCFVTHLLATHPEVQRRVQAEIDSILSAAGGKLSYDALQSMKYTDMVISEALRLWPPAIVTDRVCVKPYTLPATATNPSVRFEVGDAISIPVLALHRDPDHFDNPMDFQPERFREENRHKIKPFTYIPFGAGPRICIGMRFALMETKIALACILSRFDLKVVPKTRSPLTFTKSSMAVEVEGGFWLGIAPRAEP